MSFALAGGNIFSVMMTIAFLLSSKHFGMFLWLLVLKDPKLDHFQHRYKANHFYQGDASGLLKVIKLYSLNWLLNIIARYGLDLFRNELKSHNFNGFSISNINMEKIEKSAGTRTSIVAAANLINLNSA